MINQYHYDVCTVNMKLNGVPNQITMTFFHYESHYVLIGWCVGWSHARCFQHLYANLTSCWLYRFIFSWQTWEWNRSTHQQVYFQKCVWCSPSKMYKYRHHELRYLIWLHECWHEVIFSYWLKKRPVVNFLKRHQTTKEKIDILCFANKVKMHFFNYHHFCLRIISASASYYYLLKQYFTRHRCPVRQTLDVSPYETKLFRLFIHFVKKTKKKKQK